VVRDYTWSRVGECNRREKEGVQVKKRGRRKHPKILKEGGTARPNRGVAGGTAEMHNPTGGNRHSDDREEAKGQEGRTDAN